MFIAMDHNKTTLERAFELASSGRWSNVQDTRSQLKLEGYDERQIYGRVLAFVGAKAKLELKNESTVSLTAPTGGDMPGILIYGQAAAVPRKFSIESRNAQKFFGTVYVPSDDLTVGGDRDGDGVCDVAAEDEDDDDDDDEDDRGRSKCSTGVGGLSDWTAIIAHTLNLTAGVKLVLKSNYASSTVPVPPGIGPTSQKLMLVK
jgi:hypothetical protein